MAYLVLARKYRPETLAALVGQDHIARALGNALAMKRIPHALLFCGARGTGKTSTARIVAKMLNCEQGPTETPCGICSACREITAGNSVDVQELDAASNRGIDEIRELRSGVGFAPSRDRYKVYIVDEAHMLTDQAANAFLKTLEEPPAHVVFILATTDPQRLPVTIRSRCQRYDFKRVRAQDVVKRLEWICQQEQVACDVDALYLIAREGDGSMRDALSLLDQVIAFAGAKLDSDTVAGLLGVADRARTHQLLKGLLDRDAGMALAAVGAAHENGMDLRTLARNLALDARDLMVVKLAGTQARQLIDRSDSEVEELQKLAGNTPVAELERISHVLLEVAEQVNRARHGRLALELGLVRLCRAPQMVDVAELAARVESLLALGPRAVVPGSRPGGGATGAAPTGAPGGAPGGSYGRPGGYGASPRTAQAAPASEPGGVLRPVEVGVRAGDVATPVKVVGDADLPALTAAVAQRLQRPIEASLLDQAVVASCRGRTLQLGWANEFLVGQAGRPELLELFSQAAGLLWGGHWQVGALMDPRARTDSLVAKSGRDREEKRQVSEASLRRLPAVQAVMTAFGGTISRVYLENSNTD
ncbi:MAG: DNA polymerase III subunit gamma/tau [Deltaproteobacteria bacterium]|nr:DNA polymerase III subunit gamma/tau [Deltaproteobacteria bacterium]